MDRLPLSQEKLDLLRRHLGLGAIVARIGDIDLDKGCAQLNRTTKIMWTKDKCRISITCASDTTIASCSPSPDPECPTDSYDEWKANHNELGGES